MVDKDIGIVIIPKEEVVRVSREAALQRTCHNCKLLKRWEPIVEMRYFRVKDRETGRYRKSKKRRREGVGDLYICELGRRLRTYRSVNGNRIDEIPEDCPDFQANREVVEKQLRNIEEYEKMPSIWEQLGIDTEVL